MDNELRTGEDLFKKVKGDTWKIPGRMRGKISGNFIFTNQRIIFRTWGPFKDSVAYDIEYKNIKSLKPYRINLFLRTGILITTADKKEYKISVMKRKRYMEYISQFTL